MAFAISRRTALGIAPFAILTCAFAAKAEPTKFTVGLTGGEQVPPVQTSGSGSAELSYDPDNRMVIWAITYSGLSGQITMANFQGPAPAGKNGPATLPLARPGLPILGAIKGGAILTREQAAQFEAGQWYINLNTKAHPNGEVRGQVAPPPD
jgi:hypothetical protein